MAKTDQGFLSRWSRLKREEQASEPARRDQPPAAEPEAAASETVDPEVVEKLPDIESLDESSDFTVFLQDGVPEALRRRALRKLWRLNPIFANLDGLNDYDDDFTDAATVVENLKTLYQVGKGMPDPVKPEPLEEADDGLEAAASEAPAEESSAAGEVARPAQPQNEMIELEQPVTADTTGTPEPAPTERPKPGTAVRRRWGLSDAGDGREV